MTASQAADSTPEDLLGQVALGDRTAFRRLYQATAAHLFPIALRILSRRDLAEEAVQEAYVQIWNKAGEFRPGSGSARAWMGSIVRYRSLDALRRRPPEVSMDYERPDEGFDPIGRLANGTDLQLCFEELSDEQREAIGLAYVQGYSHSELSAKLNTPLGTVKSWVRRGLAALKECLSR